MSGQFFDSGAMNDSIDRKMGGGMVVAGLASYAAAMICMALGVGIIRATSKKPALGYFMFSLPFLIVSWMWFKGGVFLSRTHMNEVTQIVILVTGALLLFQSIAVSMRSHLFKATNHEDWFKTEFWLFSEQSFAMAFAVTGMVGLYDLLAYFKPEMVEVYGPYISFLLPLSLLFGFIYRRLDNTIDELNARGKQWKASGHQNVVAEKAQLLAVFREVTRKVALIGVFYWSVVAFLVLHLVTLMNIDAYYYVANHAPTLFKMLVWFQDYIH